MYLINDYFLAMDECEKKGRICPPALKCLKQKDKSYACDCDPGYKIVGEGNNWTCKGTITDYSTNGFLFPRPLSTFMCQCRRHLATVIASGSITNCPRNLFPSLQSP